MPAPDAAQLLADAQRAVPPPNRAAPAVGDVLHGTLDDAERRLQDYAFILGFLFVRRSTEYRPGRTANT